MAIDDDHEFSNLVPHVDLARLDSVADEVLKSIRDDDRSKTPSIDDEDCLVDEHGLDDEMNDEMKRLESVSSSLKADLDRMDSNMKLADPFSLSAQRQRKKKGSRFQQNHKNGRISEASDSWETQQGKNQTREGAKKLSNSSREDDKSSTEEQIAIVLLIVGLLMLVVSILFGQQVYRSYGVDL